MILFVWIFNYKYFFLFYLTIIAHVHSSKSTYANAIQSGIPVTRLTQINLMTLPSKYSKTNILKCIHSLEIRSCRRCMHKINAVYGKESLMCHDLLCTWISKYYLHKTRWKYKLHFNVLVEHIFPDLKNIIKVAKATRIRCIIILKINKMLRGIQKLYKDF